MRIMIAAYNKRLNIITKGGFNPYFPVLDNDIKTKIKGKMISLGINISLYHQETINQKIRNKQLRHTRRNLSKAFSKFNHSLLYNIGKYGGSSNIQLKNDVCIENKPQDICLYKHVWKFQWQYGSIRTTRNQSFDKQKDKKEIIVGIAWIHNLVNRTRNRSLQVTPHGFYKYRHITNQRHGEFLSQKV